MVAIRAVLLVNAASGRASGMEACISSGPNARVDISIARSSRCLGPIEAAGRPLSPCMRTVHADGAAKARGCARATGTSIFGGNSDEMKMFGTPCGGMQLACAKNFFCHQPRDKTFVSGYEGPSIAELRNLELRNLLVV
eukprot:scaffold102330_cov63-Phaeocystis_antarctica.AAC.2